MNTVKSSNDFADVLKGKVVVADTSSLLMTGTKLLDILSNCLLVIPSVVVSELEEKRTHRSLGYLSRDWIRLLEKLRSEHGSNLSDKVYVVDSDGVYLRIEPNNSSQSVLPGHLQNGSNDSTVLAVLTNMRDSYGEGGVETVLLSNDTPMRLHATLDLNIDAFEFNANKVVGGKPFSGKVKVVIESDGLPDDYFSDPQAREKFILGTLPKDAPQNVFVELVLDGKVVDSAIVLGDSLVPLKMKQRVSGIVAKNVEQNIALTYLKEPCDAMPVVSLGGSAGTGKTLLTVAVALDELKTKRYDKIMVFKSLHEFGVGQELGFLPGDVNDKMAAWSGSVFDAIDVIANKSKKRNQEKDDEIKRLKSMIEICPVTFLRGRSLANTFIIIEEAQNFSRNELLNILSRVAEGTKVVLTFDSAQVDNKFLQSGSNAEIWSVIDSLSDSHMFAHITLENTERSKVAELASSLLE